MNQKIKCKHDSRGRCYSPEAPPYLRGVSKCIEWECIPKECQIKEPEMNGRKVIDDGSER